MDRIELRLAREERMRATRALSLRRALTDSYYLPEDDGEARDAIENAFIDVVLDAFHLSRQLGKPLDLNKAVQLALLIQESER